MKKWGDATGRRGTLFEIIIISQPLLIFSGCDSLFKFDILRKNTLINKTINANVSMWNLK